MSTRDTILESFKTMAGNITVGNGFVTTVAKSERKFTFWDQIKEYPHVMILGGDESFEDTLGGETSSWMELKIKGYSRDREEPEVALCNIIGDLIRALNSSTYNSYRTSTMMLGVQTDEGWIHSESEGIGMFQINVRVLYQFDRGNP